MAHWSLAPVLLLVFFGTVALAQPIYQWKDETGRWHFSDFSPHGITAKTLMTPESDPATLRTQLADSLLAANESQEQAVSKLPTAHASDVVTDSSDPRWLLILPPITQARTDNGKPFSGWTPVQFFDSSQACNRYKLILIGNASDVADFQLLNSNCIPAAKFITGKEADVIIAVTQFEPVAVGFNSYLLSGKVFNRGQATARNVVAKYQIRHATGPIIMQGEVPTSPGEIPGLTFAEFRTPPSISGWVLNGSSVQAEADWSKK